MYLEHADQSKVVVQRHKRPDSEETTCRRHQVGQHLIEAMWVHLRGHTLETHTVINIHCTSYTLNYKTYEIDLWQHWKKTTSFKSKWSLFDKKSLLPSWCDVTCTLYGHVYASCITWHHADVMRITRRQAHSTPTVRRQTHTNCMLWRHTHATCMVMAETKLTIIEMETGTRAMRRPPCRYSVLERWLNE